MVEKKIYDMQSPATKALMDRPVSEDAEWQNAKREKTVSANAQCLKADGSVDLNVRELTKEDHDAYQELRRKRGAWFEEARTAYLTRMAKEGKIHVSLMSQIETDHVMPPEEVKEKAEKAYLGTLQSIKEKFKDLMNSIFKPSYAEIMAEGMKKSAKELKRDK